MVDCSLTEWSHWEKVVDNWPKWRKLICSTRERFIENRPDEKKKKEENEQGKEEVDKKNFKWTSFCPFRDWEYNLLNSPLDFIFVS